MQCERLSLNIFWWKVFKKDIMQLLNMHRAPLLHIKEGHCFFFLIVIRFKERGFHVGQFPQFLFIKLCLRIFEDMWVWKWGRKEVWKHGSFFISSLLVLISDTYLLTSLYRRFCQFCKTSCHKKYTQGYVGWTATLLQHRGTAAWTFTATESFKITAK